jgi:hypothetical protein
VRPLIGCEGKQEVEHACFEVENEGKSYPYESFGCPDLPEVVANNIGLIDRVVSKLDYQIMGALDKPPEIVPSPIDPDTWSVKQWITSEVKHNDGYRKKIFQLLDESDALANYIFKAYDKECITSLKQVSARFQNARTVYGKVKSEEFDHLKVPRSWLLVFDEYKVIVSEVFDFDCDNQEAGGVQSRLWLKYSLDPATRNGYLQALAQLAQLAFAGNLDDPRYRNVPILKQKGPDASGAPVFGLIDLEKNVGVTGIWTPLELFVLLLPREQDLDDLKEMVSRQDVKGVTPDLSKQLEEAQAAKKGRNIPGFMITSCYKTQDAYEKAKKAEEGNQQQKVE